MSLVAELGQGEGQGPAASAGAPALAPPWLSGGAQSQSVSIDWIRLCGPRAWMHRAVSLIVRALKGEQPKAGKGRYVLAHSWKWWDGTVGVYYDEGPEAKPWAVVELTGSACNLLGQAKLRKLIKAVMGLGYHVTRADFALDVRGESIGLVDLIESSCRRGELTGARVWGVDRRQTVSGEVRGEMVMIGKRGNEGGGRYVRAYDKGLETKTAERGQWVRLELEQADEVAHEAIVAMFEDEERWGAVLAGYVLGAVDFRDVTGRRELSRRPRLEWWRTFLGVLETLRAKTVRVPATLTSYRRWLTRSVLRSVVARAEHFGVEPWALLQAMADESLQERDGDCLRSLLHAELTEAIGSGHLKLEATL